jgi:hypothetical protein
VLKVPVNPAAVHAVRAFATDIPTTSGTFRQEGVGCGVGSGVGAGVGLGVRTGLGVGAAVGRAVGRGVARGVAGTGGPARPAGAIGVDAGRTVGVPGG